MGLAASQARFLNLTARKTNIEYEGQQINQQRTTLANESANTYNQMLTLSVPTPPSETAYQTVVYKFSYAGQTFNINQITKSSSNNGRYTISYTTSDVENRLSESSNIYPITENDGKYYYASKELKPVNSTYVDEKDNNKTKNYFSAEEQNGIVNELKNASGDNTLTTGSTYFVNVGTTASPKYVYFTQNGLKKAVSSSSVSHDASGYVYGDVTSYSNGAITNAVVTRDANNRIAAIASENFANGTSLTVSSSTVLDETAYNDAYNEYEYQTYLYQQKMEEINAQTSVIQAQDKKLELRLKQLDTEQSAISTEMDSISSVLDKNIENSFKTFA